jgi:RNA polymerase sigma factor (sigma-70 family)
MDNLAMTRIVRRLHASFGATHPSGESDRQLLERFLGGDQSAFAGLVTRHGRTVLAGCRHVLANPADIDDAFQATFLVLFQKARGLAPEESIGRWLYAVAHRVAVRARFSAARRRDREAAAGTQRPTDTGGPDLSWREACAVLHEELDRLPERYRLPLLLCYLLGQSRDEAARSLGWTLGAVKGRLERGRKALAVRLTRRGITLSAGLLAMTTASSAKSAILPNDLAERTVRAAAGRASRTVRMLARVAFPGTVVSKRAIASGLLLTALLGFGWYASAAGDREKTQASDKTSAPAADPPGSRPVAGRVLDPAGKPVAGAKLFVPAYKSLHPVSYDDVDVRTAATTGADGRFTAAAVPLWANDAKAYVIAYAPGFGVGWAEIDDMKNPKALGDLTLRLVRDVPVTGRVINTEGRPVPGVSVAVAAIDTPPGDKLDNYLAGWQRDIDDAIYSSKHSLHVLLNRITGPATTDRDGRFTLRGAGAERVIQLLVQGGGVARTRFCVVTRPGFDPKPYNDLLLKKENEDLRAHNRFFGLFAPDFTFIAEPGRQLTGVVTDAGTGKPIAGCRLSAYAGFGDEVTAATDGRGRYRLDGVLTDRTSLTVDPPPGSDYLPLKTPPAADAGGLTPLRMDVRLSKGAVVTGRVVDKQTGKGVKGGVSCVPLADNKFFASRPEFSGRMQCSAATDDDGRFRLVTFPGSGMLMTYVHPAENLNGQYLRAYRGAAPDPAHPELFRKEDGRWFFVMAGNLYEFLDGRNAVKVVDVKETGETAAELSVDRGATARLVVHDPDGKPLAGAWAAGLTEQWPITYQLTEQTATVYALDPAKPRTLVLYHAGRHLGGMVTLRGDEKEPVVAKLIPLARVTGRLLDADGQPLGGATVSVVANGQIARELYRFAAPCGPPVVADKGGRYALADVLPGVPFRLRYRSKGDTALRDGPGQKTFLLKPGESRDLGDQKLEPRP